MLHLGDLLGMQVLLFGLERARLGLDVNDQRLHLTIEDPHQVPIPADPDLAARVLRGNRVIRLRHLDVTVPVDGPAAFLEAGESTRG